MQSVASDCFTAATGVTPSRFAVLLTHAAWRMECLPDAPFSFVVDGTFTLAGDGGSRRGAAESRRRLSGESKEIARCDSLVREVGLCGADLAQGTAPVGLPWQ